ncbi:MAG: purine-nucleoside phosphorylase [Clostridiales bacterium]|nr:purine-nucleoside phosphorylase [Clostridiales bacterium]
MRQNFDHQYYQASADYILSQIDFKPEVGLILGSTLGGTADSIENPVTLDYRDIPNFLQSTVKSHAGKLILGQLAGKNVACLSGRFHYYEGYDFEELAAPVRVLKLMGVETLILTNAAGAVNEGYKPGDVMLIKDHIKLTGASPLRGANIEEFGKRFFDVSDMYTEALRDLAKGCAGCLGMSLREGDYFFYTGPNFETPAEIRAVRILGGDAVGMSTVTEALTAAHCGMKTLALSLITNMAAGVLKRPVSPEEINATGAEAAERLGKLIAEVIGRL